MKNLLVRRIDLFHRHINIRETEDRFASIIRPYFIPLTYDGAKRNQEKGPPHRRRVGRGRGQGRGWRYPREEYVIYRLLINFALLKATARVEVGRGSDSGVVPSAMVTDSIRKLYYFKSSTSARIPVRPSSVSTVSWYLLQLYTWSTFFSSLGFDLSLFLSLSLSLYWDISPRVFSISNIEITISIYPAFPLLPLPTTQTSRHTVGQYNCYWQLFTYLYSAAFILTH